MTIYYKSTDVRVNDWEADEVFDVERKQLLDREQFIQHLRDLADKLEDDISWGYFWLGQIFYMEGSREHVLTVQKPDDPDTYPSYTEKKWGPETEVAS